MSQAPQEQSPSGRVDLDAKLEAEIEAALGDMSVEDMLDIEKPRQPTTSSERIARTGKVVAVRGEDVFVEFGPRSQGVCPLMQFESPPEPGQELPFIVERVDEADGLLILSREGAVQKADWDSLEVGQVVEGRCIGMIKGGLEVQIGSHKAFLPASQVDVHFIKDISVLLQEKIQAEVIELNKRRGRVVLSRKKVLEVEREKRRRELMQSVEVGKQISAVITSVQPYGAFADIGGMDGLIHISDMSYQRIAKPDEVVKEGDQVTVQVLKVDMNQKPPRISLGMKQCIADPFETKANELEPGTQVSGKVTRIMPFGAFIEIAPGVEGLIHISELAHERVNKVEHVVKPDEVVTCQVLSVDPSARRISLSLKAMKDKPQHDGRGGHGDDDAELSRADDPTVRKLRAQLSRKFGDNLKGGIG